MPTEIETSGGFPQGAGIRGAHIRSSRAQQAEAIAGYQRPVRHVEEPKTGRARISAAKAKKARPTPLAAPTLERLAKGDVAIPRTYGAPYRALSAAETLRDREQLLTPSSRMTEAQVKQLHEKGKLDHDPKTSEAMFQAAEKLKRHFDGCMIGVKAQDLNRVITSGGGDNLTQEEAWVHHFDTFQKACKLMGWSESNPHRGAGRITVAVVCYEMTITDAAAAHIGRGREETVRAQALDRLREGLFSLATFWKML